MSDLPLFGYLYLVSHNPLALFISQSDRRDSVNRDIRNYKPLKELAALIQLIKNKNNQNVR